MSNPAADYIRDLAPFCDLGSRANILFEDSQTVKIQLHRRGEPVTIILTQNSGVTEERRDGSKRLHSSFAAFLASEQIGALAKLAQNQRILYKPKSIMRVPGRLGVHPESWEPGLAYNLAQRFLSDVSSDEVKTRLLLIEGTAGIGKSRLIEEETAKRAHSYDRDRLPLIVHVESRGRLLAFINEVVAFTLQRLRWDVTYEQLPVLCRHGLVIVAIDGFDELGDPNGYENAWAQVRDFVEGMRGGTLLLAGRETFIGRERLVRAIPLLAQSDYEIGVLQLEPMHSTDAMTWLVNNGWSKERVEQSRLLEAGSYALRPFFLAELAKVGQEGTDAAKPALAILVDALLQREVGKVPVEMIRKYRGERVLKYFENCAEEIARYMRDGESDCVDPDVLLWLCDLTSEEFDEQTRRMLRGRAKSLPFLTPDGQTDARRFAHTEFLNYFLSWALVRALTRGENPDIPKFVRRTILGMDFLNVFCMVVNHCIQQNLVAQLCERLRMVLTDGVGFDRSETNLWAVAFACLASKSSELLPRFQDIALEEVVVRGKIGAVEMERVWISQLDIRSADVSALDWGKESAVRTLIVDEVSRLGPSFPKGVEHVELMEDGVAQSLVGDKAQVWVDSHRCGGRREGAGETIRKSYERESAVWKLTQRICYKMLHQYWIREGSDDPSSSLLFEDEWQNVKKAAERCGLLRSEQRQAAGSASVFYHLRKARKVLRVDSSDPEVRCFLEAIDQMADEKG